MVCCPICLRYFFMTDSSVRDYVIEKELDYWENLTQEQYDDVFEGSAIRRAKFDKFTSNVSVVVSNISAK